MKQQINAHNIDVKDYKEDDEFELDIQENDNLDGIKIDTESKKKEEFTKKYKKILGNPIDTPKIYSTEQSGQTTLKTYLRENDIIKYIFYKKQKNYFVNDIHMIVFPQPKKEDKSMQVNTYSHQISQEIANIIEQNQNKQKTLVRKVLLCKQENTAHIACFVIFIDPKSTNNNIITTHLDIQYLEPLSLYINNVKKSFITLQSDRKSCGIVALKMAKHLTKEWYMSHRDFLLNSKDMELPNKQYPEKLLSYQQKDLWKLEIEFNDVFKKLLDKQYIKHIKIPNENESRIVNCHLQEQKTRRLYENRYQKLKKKHKTKQNIKQDLEKRYNNNIVDSSNSDISSDDGEFITHYQLPKHTMDKIKEYKDKSNKI